MTYAIGNARLLPLSLNLVTRPPGGPVPWMFVALALAALGCETNPVVPPRDAGNDAAFTLPDGVVPCMTDVDCNDHIACTRDTCLPGVMVCAHTGDDTVCDDDIFCNGREVCDFFEGCIAVRTHETCDDGDVCTLDRCDEATKTCEHVARDLDQDGDPDIFCDGNDCDDRDPTRSGLAPELCDDREDNDCDGVADEGSLGDAGADVGPRDGGMGACGRPAHDNCSDPLAITSSGVTTLLLGGASADYSLSCVGLARPDLVVSLTLTDARDLRLTAEGDVSATSMSLRNTCLDGATQLDCNYSFPAEIRRRNMLPGTYYIIIQGSGEVLLDVELLPPTMAPTNETCTAPTVIPPMGGHFTGSFLDVTNDTTISCNGGVAPDLVYQIDLAAESDLSVSLTTPDGQYMSWEVRPTCASTTGALRCAQGSPASSTLHQVPAGTYFIIIEGPTRPEVDFDLDVHVGPSTPRVAGDLCATAIPVTLGTPYAGTLSGAEDDINTTPCGFNYVDVTHTFTLTATSDLEVLVEGASLYTLNASLRTTCETQASQLRCLSGRPIASHVRAVPAGTYYLVLESSRRAGYTLTVNATAPTTPTPTSGNETCGSPTIIPITGGFWSGSTATSVSDYDPMAFCGNGTPANDVAFRLDLSARSRVTATTEGSSFDTILYRMVGTCRTRMEAVCDDDGAGTANTSQLSETLDPGTYFYIVDGFGTGYQGNYEFQVFISPL